MPRLAYQTSAGATRTMGRRWSRADDALLRERIAVWPVARLAAALDRTPQAIRARCWRLRLRCASAGWLTSTQAARLSGYTQQHLTTLARRGRIAARRVPGGRWWLFAADSLPCAIAGGRRRWAA